jgi:hypothetical protein
MSRSKPSVGDILLCNNVSSHKGTLYADDLDAKLVMVFLGTVADDNDPDVPDRMRRLGWARTVVYEVSLLFGKDDQFWHHRLNFEADTPKDAALAAIRFAEVMSREENKADEGSELKSLSICTMTLGKIGDDGVPHNGRGPAFVQWGNEAEESLDDLTKRIEEL